jgi:hypothetical protein
MSAIERARVVASKGMHQPRHRSRRDRRQQQVRVVADQHIGMKFAAKAQQRLPQALQVRWRSSWPRKHGRRLFPRCITCSGMAASSKRVSRAVSASITDHPPRDDQRTPQLTLIPAAHPLSEIVRDTNGTCFSGRPCFPSFLRGAFQQL